MQRRIEEAGSIRSTSRDTSSTRGVLTSHRSGGMKESFLEIGRLVVEDAELILRGLPPQICKRAERETVAKFRSKPVAVS